MQPPLEPALAVLLLRLLANGEVDKVPLHMLYTLCVCCARAPLMPEAAIDAADGCLAAVVAGGWRVVWCCCVCCVCWTSAI
jgi:hypothetical protein